jgi:hypothetical protein
LLPLVAHVAADQTFHHHTDIKLLNNTAMGLGVTPHELIYQFALRGIYNILNTSCSTDLVSRAYAPTMCSIITAFLHVLTRKMFHGSGT